MLVCLEAAAGFDEGFGYGEAVEVVGEGWEFGKCLWSPSRDHGGRNWYAIMKVPEEGDLVLHMCEEKKAKGTGTELLLNGRSYVAQQAGEKARPVNTSVNNQPPAAPEADTRNDTSPRETRACEVGATRFELATF